MSTVDHQTYRICAETGLLAAGLAAATASAGHIGAFRWGNSTNKCHILGARAVWTTETGPSVAQFVGLDMLVVRGYTASHTGGTDLTTAPAGYLRDVRQGASLVTDLRLATTGALTNGTHSTDDVNSIARGRMGELASGASVYTGSFSIEYAPGRYGGGPLVLRKDEGILLRNLVLTANSLTARVVWEIDWREMPN